ncbi:MAG: HAD family hydrolase [Planctomycetota bacterium]|jgi:phosphoglycolate phosphatase
MSVLSNKPDDFTNAMCRALLANWAFAAFVGTCDQHPKKPDPSRAVLLAEQMKRPPEQVVLVGDSPTDVQTGRRAGMQCVAVTWGFSDRPELEAAGPDRLVERPEGLPAAILG